MKSSNALRLAFCLAFLLPLQSVSADSQGVTPVVFVKGDATGANDGSSWADAFTDLQSGLALDGVEIWVARGLYVPGNTRESRFQIRDGVRVYGGFLGDESVREERDWQTNVTVLSGDIGGDDVVDEHGVVLDANAIVGENAYNVVYFRGSDPQAPILGPETVLDGFAITAGQATGPPGEWDGGGIRCSARGEIFDPAQCSPSLSNLVVRGNAAVRNGGGFHAVANYGQISFEMRNTTFVGNAAGQGGGAMQIDAMSSSFTVSRQLLEGIEFLENRAMVRGGAVSVYFGTGANLDLEMKDVVFEGNVAAQGAALSLLAFDGMADVRLNRTTLAGNHAVGTSGDSGQGGALSALIEVFASLDLTVVNSEVLNNTADQNGGGIVLRANDGLIAATLMNSTIRDNQAPLGGAINARVGEFGGQIEVALHNSIAWGNTAESADFAFVAGTANGTAALSFANSLIEGGVSGEHVVLLDNASSTDLGDNLTSDPRFVSSSDSRLQGGSPAVDTGDNSVDVGDFDLAGDVRRIDGNRDGAAIIDMGAYEYGADIIFSSGFEAQPK